MYSFFEYTLHEVPEIQIDAVSKPLPDDIAKDLLLNGLCHVDHEGFDLNEIEQAYYQHNNIALEHDSTWYKDGGMSNGTNAIINPWFIQTNADKLIIDHSQFVVRYPIMGQAREQVGLYAALRPELLRILSAQFKCGLDLCIDFFSEERVEPIVHVEWDFDNANELQTAAREVTSVIEHLNWIESIPTVLRYNKLARAKKVDAFVQADTRSMILFGEKSYKLIPTL